MNSKFNSYFVSLAKEITQPQIFSARFIRKAFYLAVLSCLALLTGSAQAAPAGREDFTFGVYGKTTANFTSYDAITDIAFQPDGKIVASKLVIVNGANDFGVSRFNADGSLDQSFGSGGNATINVLNGQDYAYSVAVQLDGKIVISGSVDSPQGFFRTGIVRYNSNGTLDTTFGNGGKVVIETESNQANAMAIQPDGKIVVAGHTTDFTGGTRANFLVVRCNANGTLDNSFGSGGTVITDFFTANDVAYDLALQTDGKIVVAGTTWLDTKAGNFAIVRYNNNGSLDASFGSAGKLTTDFFSNLDDARAVAVQVNGKIVVGGSAFGPNGKVSAIARYNADGSLDNGFDADGKVTSNFPQLGINDLTVQANNKIIGGGTGKLLPTDEYSFAVARFNENGTPDLTFDYDGRESTYFDGYSVVNALALQPDGKLVAAGSAFEPNLGATGNALARYILTNAAADFDGDNRTDVSVFRPADGTWYLSQSSLGFSATQFGISSDVITPADFDGDGKADIAVFRNGIWYILQSLNNQVRVVQFGQAGDVPVVADYDGDGLANIAVFRAGVWYILDSATNESRTIQFGLASDKPVPADYDRDGDVDIAVYREGFWYIFQPSFQTVALAQFGNATDIPIAADFDGDGKADQAVFRNGTWYLNRSQNGITAVQFGEASDIPLAGDFDGDDVNDIAVYRSGNWYFLNSMNGFSSVQFGTTNDRPLPDFYQP